MVRGMPTPITAWKDSQGRLHESEESAVRADASYRFAAEYADCRVDDLTLPDLFLAFLLACIAEDRDVDVLIKMVRADEGI